MKAVHGIQPYVESACARWHLHVLVAWVFSVKGVWRRAWDGLYKNPIGGRDSDGLAQLQGILLGLELESEALVQADEGDLCLQGTTFSRENGRIDKMPPNVLQS